MMNNHDIRQKARKIFKENYLPLMIPTVVSGILTSGVSEVTKDGNLLMNLVAQVIAAIIGMGLVRYYLTVIRSKESVKGKTIELLKLSYSDLFTTRVLYVIGTGVMNMIALGVIAFVVTFALYGVILGNVGSWVIFIVFALVGILFLNYAAILQYVIQDTCSSENALPMLTFGQVIVKAVQILFKNLWQYIRLQIAFVIGVVVVGLVTITVMTNMVISSNVWVLAQFAFAFFVLLLIASFTVIPYYLTLIGTWYNEVSKADGTIFQPKNTEE